MKYTCIIGGNGFIGKYLASLLSAEGKKVKIIGRNPVTDPDPAFIYNYINQLDDLPENYFDDVEYVVHAAYIGTPKSSYDDPVGDINQNLLFSVRLFERLLESDIKKIIFISSGGAVYGQQLTDIITEDHPTYPISPYGITKLCIEKYAQLFHISKSLPIVIVRPSNAYGSGQHANTGQGFITAVLDAIENNHALEVYGKSGTIRDYIHVSDIAKGVNTCLHYGIAGEEYNIGTGIGISNLDIVNKLTCLYNYKNLKINIMPERPFDVKMNILNFKKLQEISGWYPEYDIDLGLKEIMNHSLLSGNKIG